jgi:hypothetical protein
MTHCQMPSAAQSTSLCAVLRNQPIQRLYHRHPGGVNAPRSYLRRVSRIAGQPAEFSGTKV